MDALKVDALKRATGRGLVMSLFFLGALGLGALSLGASGCYSAARPTQQASVQFLLDPPNARIYVEDRFIGAGRVLRRRPPSFRPGVRHFTVTAEGYFPHDVEIDLPPGRTTVRLSLRPIPR